MKKYIHRIYAAFAVVTVFLFLIAGADFELNVTKRKVTSGYRELTEYDHEKIKDYSAPAGVREEYIIRPGDISAVGGNLIFYTIHQNAEVYAGDERIYSMRAKHDNFWGRTPGYIWNDVTLTAGDDGEAIRVVIYPVYKSSVGLVPDFYFGDKNELFRDVVRGEIFSLFFSIVGIVAGIAFIGYTLYNYKNSELDKSLAMLGCFSLVVSLWELTDMRSIGIWFPEHPELYILPLLLLQLQSVPFTLFAKELSSVTKEKKIWYAPCIASFAAQALTLILQVAGLCDLRETLWLTHLTIVFTFCVTVSMLVYEVRTAGWNVKLKRNAAFVGICFLGFATDMLFYYITKGKTVTILGIIGFDMYVLAEGIFFMRDAKRLMTIGMKARNFERMAYHDQLTGLLNRTAFASDITAEDFAPEHCIVAVFDLNDLKTCNDVLGHEKGDVYIRECAEALKDVFGEVGRCYRMGGDEFFVLMRDVSLEQCKQKLNLMRETIRERNKRYPEINMGVACGFEIYDKRVDYDINDTSRRADKQMYREKYSMKEKNA